jgi:transposase
LIRKQVLNLLKHGIENKQIASCTGLSLRRVQVLAKEYEETGKLAKPKPRGRKLGYKRLLTPQHEREIKRLITDKYPDQYKFDCMLWTPNAVRELIFRKYGIKLGKTTMVNYLASWGMSCQRPAKRAYKQNHENTETFKKEVYPSIKKLANAQNADIYFGDESGINNQAYNPMRYAPKNCPTVVKFVTSMETVNMMSAVSPSGALRFMLYEEQQLNRSSSNL